MSRTLIIEENFVFVYQLGLSAKGSQSLVLDRLNKLRVDDYELSNLHCLQTLVWDEDLAEAAQVSIFNDSNSFCVLWHNNIYFELFIRILETCPATTLLTVS